MYHGSCIPDGTTSAISKPLQLFAKENLRKRLEARGQHATLLQRALVLRVTEKSFGHDADDKEIQCNIHVANITSTGSERLDRVVK